MKPTSTTATGTAGLYVVERARRSTHPAAAMSHRSAFTLAGTGFGIWTDHMATKPVNARPTRRGAPPH